MCIYVNNALYSFAHMGVLISSNFTTIEEVKWEFYRTGVIPGNQGFPDINIRKTWKKVFALVE